MSNAYMENGAALRNGVRDWLRWWPVWAPVAATLWSALYATLGIWWMTGRGSFPFGAGPRSGPAASLFAGVNPAAASPVVAGLSLAGVVVALMMLRGQPRAGVRRALLGYAWFMAVTLLVLVPDARAIVAVAYAPAFLIGAPFGWPPADFSDAIPWSVLNQYLCIMGGLAWAATAIAFERAARGVCIACGRGAAAPRWTYPAAARQWGKWATATAVIMPLPYAITRFAWAFGIPLGIDPAVLRVAASLRDLGAAAALGSVALTGSLLTLGLSMRWGDIFPRWLPFLRNRRVPPMLAIVPATLASLLIFAAGLSVLRESIRSALRGESWVAIDLVGLLWPLWGLSLGTATLAYYYRRRGRCAECERR